MYINKRLRAILKILIKSNYATTQEISHKLKISRRTTYYDIEKLYDYLQINDIDLKNKRSLGYYLNSTDKEKAEQILKYYSDDYILSSEERYIKIIIYILTYNEKLTLERLENLLGVSRNTVLNNIKDAKKYISKYKIDIKSSYGYELKGNTNDIRYLFLNLHNEYNYLFKEQDFSQEYILIKECLDKSNKEILKEKNINYSLKYLINLYKHCNKYNEKIQYSNEEKKFLKNLSSHNHAKEILRKLNKVLEREIDESEIYYIQIFIVKDSEIREFLLKQKIKDRYLSEINMMVKDFEKVSCIYIEDYNEISNNIFNHLIPSLFRLKYGIYYPNYIKDEVKNKYKSIYQFTKQVTKNVENLLGTFFNDDELVYISMYFGGYAAKMGVKIKTPTIVIVCNFGMATSQLLKNQIQDLFDLVEINDILSVAEFEKYNKIYDFAITTVDIPISNKNVIKVNPILNNLDKQNLISQISNTQSKFNIEQNLVKRIMSSIDRHATVFNKERLKEEIENILMSSNEKSEVYKVTLGDILNKNTIQLNQRATNWKEAINISAKSLLDLGIINESYIEAMIKNIENLGPYIIIAENIALPHANPEDGVNKVGMSITTFKEDIHFLENKDRKANVFIVLAPKDKQSHLNALASINKMISDKNNLEKIINAKNKEEIIELIKIYS